MKVSSGSGSVGVALSVLKKIQLRENQVCIDVYSNCREQGFFLISYLNNWLPYEDYRAVSFSQNRNSDSIIVQHGVRKDFNQYGVFLTDEMYHKCKKFFGPDEADKAARFITSWLKGE